ncbi:MAG: hypothetical protein WA364_18575 [Candidatus Nitrosopolaris sp.]
MSARNHGYAAGYELKGSHTKEFFWDYANGTIDLWYNRGYACGLSAWKCSEPGYENLQDKLQTSFDDGNTTG